MSGTMITVFVRLLYFIWFTCW